MRVYVSLVCLLFPLSFYANDACLTAVTLSASPVVCDGPVTVINFAAVSPTVTPPNGCNLMSPPDFWLHLNVPVMSTNSYIIRRRSGTTIEAQAEVLYKSACAPLNGCCEFGMIRIGCYEFSAYPNAIILKNPTPGDYYFRIWDASSAASGTFVTSAHILSSNINNWIICDDISGEGSGFRANQLIIQPGDMFDPSGYDPAFKIVDSCLCANPPLLLFQADDFDIFTEGRITAQNDPEVEGTDYNYKMEGPRLLTSVPCGSATICAPLVKYKPVSATSTTRVAIIDSGINSGHDAFENAHWENDDPKNPESCVAVEEIGYDFKFDQILPEDSLGHGSWVAGTVVEDFPSDIQLQLMALKFYSGNDDFLFDAVCAIHYAIEQGASTLVMSWGFTSAEYPDILAGALMNVHANDALVVASAGNLSHDNDDPLIGKYPANAPFDNIISATAYDETISNVPTYANYGATTVDLAAIDHVAAPGSVLSGITLDSRDSVIGTSISAPRVARTAAIIKAYYPILNAQEIRLCILNSVKRVPALIGKTATGGILDHEAAILCAASTAAAKACVKNDIVIPGTLINDVTFMTNSIITAFSVIESAASVVMKAGEYISLNAGFEVRSGAIFEADNEDCRDPEH